VRTESAVDLVLWAVDATIDTTFIPLMSLAVLAKRSASRGVSTRSLEAKWLKSQVTFAKADRCQLDPPGILAYTV
jgi:hypothetical protein